VEINLNFIRAFKTLTELRELKMFKRNWRDIEPLHELDDNCLVRYYFRRKDMLSSVGGYKITEYLEWVRHVTIPYGKKLPYQRKNMEEIFYVLQGEGVFQVGNKKNEIKAQDAIYLPSETPYTIYPTIESQPIMYMNYGIRAPPDALEVKITSVSYDEKVDSNVRIERWASKKPSEGHKRTCTTYPLFTRDMMKYFLFATMMSVPGVLGYHRHNSEAIYFISSGLGYAKIAGEELPIKEGDAL
jgi:mannose-6-phosphate isomerase-like protein (cupin superfamily)